MRNRQALRTDLHRRTFTELTRRNQMMDFDREKALNAILYITQKIKDSGFHKVFKILYFAEQKHLVRYGALIAGDTYIAMQNGPVPSKIYDILKALRHKLAFKVDLSFERKFIDVEKNHNLVAVGQVDMHIFSPSELECLNQSIEENKLLSFGKLTEKSHDHAWKSAFEDEMSIENIARAGGADEEMLKYIQSELEKYQRSRAPINWAAKYKGAMTRQSPQDIEDQLNALRNGWN